MHGAGAPGCNWKGPRSSYGEGPDAATIMGCELLRLRRLKSIGVLRLCDGGLLAFQWRRPIASQQLGPSMGFTVCN